MLVVAKNVRDDYAEYLTSQGVEKRLHHIFQKWLRFYLDFCKKYQHAILSAESSVAFIDKLKEKKQPADQRNLAAQAIDLYKKSKRPKKPPRQNKEFGHYRDLVLKTKENANRLPPRLDRGMGGKKYERREKQRSPYEGCSWVNEFNNLEGAIRTRHYSPKTLNSYRGHIRRFQAFTKSVDPQLLSATHVKKFLTYLAVEKNVSASTQNVAFNSLLFFFRHVLNKEFGQIDGVVRAKRRPYIPVVLSREEIDTILDVIDPSCQLIIKLLYGCGLRLFECLNLRVHCLNFDAEILTIHDGKGKKDRTVPIPKVLQSDLKERLEMVKQLHRKDLERGYGGVFLVNAINRKYKNASREFIWQWLFPARQLTKDKESGKRKRYHLHSTHVQKALRRAVQKAYLTKRVTAHTFRHSFASHLLQNNYDIRTIQELLGHGDVRTTMIYTHTVKSMTSKEAKSPLDF